VPSNAPAKQYWSAVSATASLTPSSVIPPGSAVLRRTRSSKKRGWISGCLFRPRCPGGSQLDTHNRGGKFEVLFVCTVPKSRCSTKRGNCRTSRRRNEERKMKAKLVICAMVGYWPRSTQFSAVVCPAPTGATVP
jgi:hypothetical protein